MTDKQVYLSDCRKMAEEILRKAISTPYDANDCHVDMVERSSWVKERPGMVLEFTENLEAGHVEMFSEKTVLKTIENFAFYAMKEDVEAHLPPDPEDFVTRVVDHYGRERAAELLDKWSQNRDLKWSNETQPDLPDLPDGIVLDINYSFSTEKWIVASDVGWWSMKYRDWDLEVREWKRSSQEPNKYLLGP